MTGSDKNGLLQSAESVVEVNYVFAFVGDTQRPDEWVDQGDEQNEWDDGKIKAIERVDANRRPGPTMRTARKARLLPGQRLG